MYPHVKQMLADNPGRIRLSIRHVPFHQGAEFVVRLLEASRAQDKYWQTLEALLATQDRWAPHHTVQPDLVWPVIAGVGLDIERLKSDMAAPEVDARMQRDIDDARAIKVTATPEYFVNGRPLPSFGLQQLQDLVNEALRSGAGPST
jgi:protein-disulfide isomerase